MHRQVIHSSNSVNISKTKSASNFMMSLNPEIKITEHDTRLSQSNVLDLIKNYDIILDGSDNALTRYLVNDACVTLKKPLVSGASVKWEGQVTIYNHGSGPCYRCLYPKCPPANSMMSCSGSGVFGPAPGIVGMVVATECAKLILGKGEILSGKILLIDLLNLRFKTVRVRQMQKKCFCCAFRQGGKLEFDLKSFDYENYIGTSCKYSPPNLINEWEIEWDQLKKDLNNLEKNEDIKIIDVRNKNHHGIINVQKFGNFEVEHLPLGKLRNLDLNEIKEMYPNTETVYIFCRSGRTSKEATSKMREAGVSAINVVGGVLKLMKNHLFKEEFIKNL